MAQLALAGGKPVRTRDWPKWPVWDESEITSLRRVLDCGEWGIGSPIVEEFETAFAETYGAKHAISCTNGTDALVIALQALGVRAGDEVIVPPYTFIATGTAVLMLGAVPVFVDINPETYNIDASLIESAITDRTKCIVPVHIAGNPADMGPILEIGRRRGIPVLEDTAQAHLAAYDGKVVGTLGNAGTWSFQSSKNHCGGEGGILCTDDDELFERLYSYQNCGRVRDGEWYEHHRLGGNRRLSAFQAAILLAQMTRVEEQSQTRETNAAYLKTCLKDTPGIAFQSLHEKATRHAYHLLVLRYNAVDFGGLSREKFLEALEAEGVPCAAGYLPLYRYPVFANLRQEAPAVLACGTDVPYYAHVSCPECERICESEAVWLFQTMLLGEGGDMDDIAAAVKKIQANQNELAD